MAETHEKLNVKKQKVYVFLGCIGSGKSYYADMVAKKVGTLRLDFKTTLVNMTYQVLGLDRDVNYEVFKTMEFQVPGTAIKFTGRQFLQRFGTDIMRAQVDQDFWCKSLINQIKELPAGRVGDHYESVPVAIADCRFFNEALELKNAGFDVEFYLTRYRSERFDDTSKHASEQLAQTLMKRQDIVCSDEPVSWAPGDKYVVRLKDNFWDFI